MVECGRDLVSLAAPFVPAVLELISYEADRVVLRRQARRKNRVGGRNKVGGLGVTNRECVTRLLWPTTHHILGTAIDKPSKEDLFALVE